MTRADFDDFLKRQAAEKTQPPGFDPQQQLTEWQSYLNQLYADINTYLEPYLGSGQALVEYEPVELNEDFSGPYTVRQMNLRIGGSTVLFKPVGTMLIGSKGRVDVQGPRGTARLSLMNRETKSARQMIKVRVRFVDKASTMPEPEPEAGPIDWVWKIIRTSPEVDFIELNEESFFDMIVAVVDA